MIVAFAMIVEMVTRRTPSSPTTSRDPDDFLDFLQQMNLTLSTPVSQKHQYLRLINYIIINTM